MFSPKPFFCCSKFGHNVQKTATSVWLCTKIFRIKNAPQSPAMFLRELGPQRETASHIILLAYFLEYYDTQLVASMDDTCIPTVLQTSRIVSDQAFDAQKLDFLKSQRSQPPQFRVPTIKTLNARIVGFFFYFENCLQQNRFSPEHTLFN